MKKKILLFAGSVLATMSLAVSAYAADLPSAGGDTLEDSRLILQEALKHTLKDTDADYSLYDIDGNKPDLKVDVTANDAALAFKRSLNATQYYLEVQMGETTKDIVLETYEEDGSPLKDLVENYLALDAESQAHKAVAAKKQEIYDKSAKDKVMDYINRVHFYSGSAKIGEVYLKDDLGWAIFGDAVKPMLKGGDATLIAATYNRAEKTASGTAKIADLYLPAIAADGAVSFQEVQKAYLAARDQAVELDAAKVPDNLKTTVNNVVYTDGAIRPAGYKYGVKLTLNEGTEFEKVYTYNKDGDLASFNSLVDAANKDGFYDYNTVTIETINKVLGTGETAKEVEVNGEKREVYGTAKLEVSGTSNTRTGSIQLVKKK